MAAVFSSSSCGCCGCCRAVEMRCLWSLGARMCIIDECAWILMLRASRVDSLRLEVEEAMLRQETDEESRQRYGT